jgi:hypothetical protein
MTALEELTAALRPLQLLTVNVCAAHFNILQADTIFQTASNALRAQQTHIADQLVDALELRYAQRKNSNLLSAIRFLTDPMGYAEESDGAEFNEVQKELKKLHSRLFLEETPVVDFEEQTEVANSSFGGGAPSENTSYAEKLAAQFRADLQNVQASKPKKCSDIVAECRSAAVTGELTDRLKKMRHALLSVQASSVEAERAFSTAGRFVTKIRNRLGDNTLDSYCFAKHKFQIEEQLVFFAVLLAIFLSKFKYRIFSLV